MIIFGIDPGLAIVGWGVIEYKNSRFRTLAHGAIQTPAHTPIETRLTQIHKELATLLTMYHPDAVAVLALETPDKLNFLAVAGKDAVATGVHAGKLVGAVAAVTGGKGGGRPDNAMAGGQDRAKIDEALACAEALLKTMLK